MTQTWQSLGWTLLHFLWQGAALFVLYWTADRLCARRGAAVRYALALTALLAMPAVAIATLAYEEGAATQPAIHTAAHARAQATTGFGSNILSLAPWDATGDAAPMGMPMPASLRALLQTALPWLDAIWLAGVFFFSLRALGGWWLLRRLRLYTLEQAPRALLLHLDALRRQMGIGRSIDLRLSRRIVNPLTAGVLKPWILLPVTAVTALSPEQLEVVLAHELAHIRRADYFWNLLQTVVETLFFFHPAVWYVSRRVRQEREFCCDDAVVARCSDPSIYASALVRLEEERNASLRFAVALNGNSRSGLRARILRILSGAEDARPFRPVSITAMCVGVVLFVCPLPRVFASFREAPRAAAAAIAPAVRHVKPLLVKAIAPPQDEEPAPRAPAGSVPGLAPAPAPETQPSPAPEPAQEANSSPQPAPSAHSDYIDRMRAAGYDVDLDKYVAMKVQGITPEYAAQMNKVFGTKLAANCLIGMKIQGVTPEYIQSMRSAGYNVPAEKYIGMKIQGVTPEYAAQMAKLGFGTPTAGELMGMKIQGVTPEYIQSMRSAGYNVPAEKYIGMKIQGVTPEYAAQMAKLGFGTPTADELVGMKIQGVTPEYIQSMRSAGYNVPAEKYIGMKIQGVTPEYAAQMAKLGFGTPTADELVGMKIQGVTPEYIQSMRSAGYNVPAEKYIGMKIQGVTPEYAAQM